MRRAVSSRLWLRSVLDARRAVLDRAGRGASESEMTMRWTDWLVVALAWFVGGWFVFDGGRALIVGDYVTPRKGPYAGQLGAWSRLARGFGIDPRSTLMKSILLTYGVVYVLIMLCFVSGVAHSHWLLAITAALGLWYWPFATLINISVIVLVMSSLA